MSTKNESLADHSLDCDRWIMNTNRRYAHQHLDELCLVNITTYGRRLIDPTLFSGHLILSIDSRDQGASKDAAPERPAARTSHLSPENYPELYDVLGQEGVQLKEIKFDYPRDALIRYIASYSGLERLEILTVPGDHHEDFLIPETHSKILSKK
ncbi:hypothetical protein B0H19DRAFT_1072770 [Mycena capillaripes]|nr:hypothetical protein B0H19DRAFT_1072770 [Mycena capillaripes]